MCSLDWETAFTAINRSPDEGRKGGNIHLAMCKYRYHIIHGNLISRQFFGQETFAIWPL